jgi:hypothetical protein
LYLAPNLELLGPSSKRTFVERQMDLDFLGFSWILSSESSLFNGLRGDSARRNFVARLSPKTAASISERTPSPKGAGASKSTTAIMSDSSALTFSGVKAPLKSRVVQPRVFEFAGIDAVSFPFSFLITELLRQIGHAKIRRRLPSRPTPEAAAPAQWR